MNKEEFKNPVIDVLLKADHTTAKKYETETSSGFFGFYDLELSVESPQHSNFRGCCSLTYLGFVHPRANLKDFFSLKAPKSCLL